MILKINEKDVELKFGVRFVRELDKVGGVDTGSFNMGMALTKAIPALQAYDPVALSNVIYLCFLWKYAPTSDDRN